jgi:hypothetical protein
LTPGKQDIGAFGKTKAAHVLPIPNNITLYRKVNPFLGHLWRFRGLILQDILCWLSLMYPGTSAYPPP